MENEEASIAVVVNETWSSYDIDNSGELEKEEARNFLSELLPDMKNGYLFSDENFEKLFNEIDTDGSGTIDRAEITEFIKRSLQPDDTESNASVMESDHCLQPVLKPGGPVQSGASRPRVLPWPG